MKACKERLIQFVHTNKVISSPLFVNPWFFKCNPLLQSLALAVVGVPLLAVMEDSRNQAGNTNNDEGNTNNNKIGARKYRGYLI